VDHLEKSLPSHMRLLRNQDYNLPAIIDAIEASFGHVDDFIENAQKQLYFPTSTGKYAIQLSAMKGFTLQRGSGVTTQRGAGVNIDGFKLIAPLATTAPKQQYATLVRLLEVFYSTSFVKASVLTDQYEPYQVHDGDELQVLVDGQLVTIPFTSSAFSNLKEISASALASYLNYLNVGITSLVVTNRNSGKIYTRMLTSAYGASGSMEIVGGTAASIFNFPSYHEPFHEVGTQFLLTKESDQSSIVTVTWDGVGTDPQLYRLKIGDRVSFRNLFDVDVTGVQDVPDTDEWGYESGTVTSRNLIAGNYSILNTWHEIEAIGYDFFIIRVYGFYPESNSGNIYLRSARDVHFQRNVAARLYDNAEYAILSETDTNALTVTIPAISPLILRNLRGAWHIHGAVADVVSFNRNSIEMAMQTIDFPDQCTFVLRSPRMEETYYRIYRSLSRAIDTWTLDSDAYLLPFTSPVAVNADTLTPFYCALDTKFLQITTKEVHAVLPGMVITIASADLADTLDVNGTLSVTSVQNKNTFTVELPSGVAHTGLVRTERVSIVRMPSTLANGANAYIQFASVGDLVASGIEENTRVRLVVDGTTVSSDAVAVFRLLNSYMGVVEISGDIAYVSASVTNGSGSICDDALLRLATERWGGSPTYFADLTNSTNQSFFANMQAILMDGFISTNELFLGSYLYDLTQQYSVTEKFAILQSAVLSGASSVILTVSDDVSDWDQSGFLVINYGTDRVEGPIRYTSVYQFSTSSWKIILDPTYLFDLTQPINSRVWHVNELQPISLSPFGKNYQPYLTSTVSARAELLRLIGLITAAGVTVDRDIIYPDVIFEDPSLSIFD
jgi:hypothetical protein